MYKSGHQDLAQKFDSQNHEIERLKEVIGQMKSEFDLHEKEKLNFILAMENVRKETENIERLKKSNADMVKKLSFQNV